LEQEEIAQSVAESTGKGGKAVEALVDLDVDSRNTEQARDQEEGKCHPGAVRDYDVRAVSS
jgi:hypothetical protein